MDELVLCLRLADSIYLWSKSVFTAFEHTLESMGPIVLVPVPVLVLVLVVLLVLD